MTNDDLKALCLQVECSSFERDVAESILRLLAQCEAMQAVVYSARQVASYRHDPEAPLDAMFKALDRALSQLGERT